MPEPTHAWCLARQDPGIPKQWPFKQELIQELEQKKALILEAEARKKQERKRARVSWHAGRRAFQTNCCVMEWASPAQCVRSDSLRSGSSMTRDLS